MRIAQVILPNASAYERKSQRADRVSLAGAHDVVLVSPDDVRASGADVAHVYASGRLPVAPFVRFPTPCRSSADVRRSRWPFRRATEPDYVVSPVIERVEQSRYQPRPEAVEDGFFGARNAEGGGQKVIGAFRRKGDQWMVELTLARIARFRDDVTWHWFDRDLAPEDLASVALWAGPARDGNGSDGFVAAASVSGLPVVASRTKINS